MGMDAVPKRLHAVVKKLNPLTPLPPSPSHLSDSRITRRRITSLNCFITVNLGVVGENNAGNAPVLSPLSRDTKTLSMILAGSRLCTRDGYGPTSSLLWAVTKWKSKSVASTPSNPSCHPAYISPMISYVL